MSEPGRRDPLARILESGLIVVLLAAPLPFAAVGPRGRLAVEVAAWLLGLLWIVRSRIHHTPDLSRPARIGIVGLVLVASLQIVPVGRVLVSVLSPAAIELRAATVPPVDAMEAEIALLGTDPATLDAPPTLSLDPGASASALRTGTAMLLLLLVAATVAATRGPKRLTLALLLSAGFQSLYGLLVLTSGHNQIWHRTKQAYLDAATGTFVNKNHFACFLAMAAGGGMALVLHNTRRQSGAARPGLAAFLGSDGSRNLLLGLLLIVVLAGLLTSFSRAGILLGLVALLLTLLLAGRSHSLRRRLLVAAMVLAVAAVPLFRVGPDRLIERYAGSKQSLIEPGGRGQVWLDSLRMVAIYPVVGTGYGSFAGAYPLHRSPEVRLFYAHAHNDLIQVVVEGGVLGLISLFLLLIPLFRSILLGLAGAKGTIAVGIAAALVAVLLHGLIDFNFHIPANAVTAAILAGALMGLPCRS